MFKIDKNIEMRKNVGGRPCKYPFNEMEVGDSFLVESGSTKKMASVLNYHNKVCEKQFSLRTVDEGVRVWRIK